MPLTTGSKKLLRAVLRPATAVMLSVMSLGAFAQTSFTTASDYGSASGTSCTSIHGTSFTMAGSGGGASSKETSDNYALCSEVSSNTNFTFTARVVSVNSSTKMAGITLRESISDASSRNETIYVAYDTSTTINPYTDRRVFADGANTSLERPAVSTTDPFQQGPDTNYLANIVPFWIQITRYGDTISMLYSPDKGGAPQEWRASTTIEAITGLASSLNIGFVVAGTGSSAKFDNVSVAAYAPSPASATEPTIGMPPITSWIGNTFQGGGEFVIYRGQALAVDGSGYLYVQGQGEEESVESLTASTGKFYAYYNYQHYNTNPAVAVSNGLLYSANSSSNGGFTFFTPQGATQQTGSGPYDVVDPTLKFTGLAADGGNYLYALEVSNGIVHKFDTSGAKVVANGTAVPPTEASHFTLSGGSGATAIAYDAHNSALWAVLPGKVQRYSLTGSAVGSPITDMVAPTGITVDASGRVYVTDYDKSDQRIHVYTGSTGAALETLGTKEGPLGETPRGSIVYTSLDHPEGIVVDANYNLYVASSGPTSDDFGNSGMTLRMYKPNSGSSYVTSLTSANLVWQDAGLEYIDGAVPDTSDDLNVYTKFHRYSMNYSNLGSNNVTSPIWKYAGELVDDITYPTDPRLTGHYFSGSYIRKINGQKFLVVGEESGGFINIFHFVSTTSEITAPYARFNRSLNGYLEIWTDSSALNGTDNSANAGCTGFGSHTTQPPVVYGGGTNEEECTQPSNVSNPYQDNYAWYMDTNGNVWSAGNDGSGYRIYEFPMTLNSSGYPTWSWKTVVSWAAPSAFGPSSNSQFGTPGGNTFPLRLIYVPPPTDTLFIAGYTNLTNKMDYCQLTPGGTNCADESKDVKNGLQEMGNGNVGTQILRYDNWVNGSQSLGCTITLATSPQPPTVAQDPSKSYYPLGHGPRDMDYANGLLVTEDDFTNRLDYYYANDPKCSAGTVAPVYSWIPGPEVGSVSGTIDSPQTVHLFYRSPYQWFTFSEEGGEHKVIMFDYIDSGVPGATK